MKCRIEDNEWRMLNQVMVEIINGRFPPRLSLECAVMYEWYEAEMSKFVIPKTRQQKLNNSRLIALWRIVRSMPDTWESDPYWQSIKIGLLTRLEQVGLSNNRMLHE